VTPLEAERLAARLGMELNVFGRRYLRQAMGRYALVDGCEGQCCFLVDNRCSVYEDRPAQCRTYPFWSLLLASPESWAHEATQCPGIGRGPVHDPRHLLEQLRKSSE
jgi:Fe-S-cluster containining protein